jgi:short-subunit dehydrogenase
MRVLGIAAGLAMGGFSCALALAARKAFRRFDLTDKLVLITGGSRGLGLALAREFLRRGSTVAICARNQDELSRARQQSAALDNRFFAFQADLRDRARAAQLIKDVQQQLGPIDVLVNNAGVIQVGPIENQTVEDFEQAMQSIFWPAVYTSLAVLPEMKSRRAGRIVNITSVGGKIAVPHLLPYTASKFALVGFSKGLCAELAKDHIPVTTVVPGLMRTGSPRNIQVKGRHEREFTWFMLGDSLPGLSMSARRAAHSIVRACVSGKSEVVLGGAAKMAVALEAFAPNLMSAIFAGTNRWVLPDAGESDGSKKGYESESWLTKSVLTALTRKAELEFNQI